MPPFNSVAVIGAGAWGTALAGVAARAGREVVLYARSAANAAEIAATRVNPKLPGVRLAPNIDVTCDIARAARAEIMLIATPAQHLREAIDGARASSGARRRRSSPAPRASNAARTDS